MNTEVAEYIAKQPAGRQNLLISIHTIIMEEDRFSKVAVSDMDDMIIYVKDILLYGLASHKDYMSLELAPLYSSFALQYKYKVLLPKARFEEGSIVFTSTGDISLNIVRQLISKCSKWIYGRWRKKKKMQDDIIEISFYCYNSSPLPFTKSLTK